MGDEPTYDAAGRRIPYPGQYPPQQSYGQQPQGPYGQGPYGSGPGGPQGAYPGQQYPGPHYDGPPPGHRRRRSWFARHKVLTGLLSVAALFIIVIAAAAASGPRVTPKATPSGDSTAAAQDTQSASSPSPTQSSPPTGSIGTTYTVTSSEGSSYDVTLDKVDQHATLGPYETLSNQADHAAAAEFTIKGDSGQTSDDANSDANAIGSDQTEYQFAAIQLTVPNFSSGLFNVAPGQTEKGWVAFELPPGVTVAQVQWAPGFSGKAATWQVSS